MEFLLKNVNSECQFIRDIRVHTRFPEICTFAEGEQKNLPKNKDFLGSNNLNGKCNFDFDPEGSDPRFQQIPSCRVEFKPSGIYSGPTSGLCFPDDSCHGTPNACQDCKNHCKSVEK